MCGVRVAILETSKECPTFGNLDGKFWLRMIPRQFER